jgi:hypothetical protein
MCGTLNEISRINKLTQVLDMQNIYDIETLLYATYNNHLDHCKESVVLIIFSNLILA